MRLDNKAMAPYIHRYQPQHILLPHIQSTSLPHEQRLHRIP